MEKSSFNGFKAETLQFFSMLEHNNNKEWFKGNKSFYTERVLDPAKSFIIEMGSSLSKLYPTLYWGTQANGSGSLMRIYRDVRFSKDKRPLKENLGIIFPLREGKKVEQPCFYFHIDTSSSFFYGGQHRFSKEILERYREAVADEKKGKELVLILQRLSDVGYTLMEEPHYKRVPREYDKDHPRERLLRQVGLGIGYNLKEEDLLGSELISDCLQFAHLIQPLMSWLLAL